MVHGPEAVEALEDALEDAREAVEELESTFSREVSARDLTIRDLREELRQARDWEDVRDQWSDAITAAHPTRSGSHDEYGVAMQMVGHRHSKGALVALVNWLLVRLKAAEDPPFVDMDGGR